MKHRSPRRLLAFSRAQVPLRLLQIACIFIMKSFVLVYWKSVCGEGCSVQWNSSGSSRFASAALGGVAVAIRLTVRVTIFI